MTDVVSPVDKVLNDIAKAMEIWAVEQRATIGQKVTQRLDKHRDDILMTLMGFEKDSWASNVWKIDHCNGRAGESAISDFLKTSQAAVVEEWMSQIKLPTMTAAFKARMTEQLQAEYEREIGNKVWQIAKNRANEDLEALLKVVLKPTLLEKIKQTYSLINLPTPTN